MRLPLGKRGMITSVLSGRRGAGCNRGKVTFFSGAGIIECVCGIGIKNLSEYHFENSYKTWSRNSMMWLWAHALYTAVDK